jgi:hypothetical protein
MAILFLGTHLPSNFRDSDVASARNNYLSSYRVDFQGALQTVTYGLIPDAILGWSSWLLLAQVASTGFGLYLADRNLAHGKNLQTTFLFTVTIYVIFSVSSQGTRDGTMLSLIILGLGLFLESLRKQSSRLRILGIIILVWGGALRPWVSLAIPLFIYSITKLKTRSTYKSATRPLLVAISISILFCVSCVLTEYALAQKLNLKSSYPEQQVMVMDLTGAYCWGNNSVTALQAQTALAEFYSDEEFKVNICQFFRPDTWVSLRDSRFPSTKNLATNFSLINPEDETRYKKVRDTWINMIKNDPVTYLQVKNTFISKLYIGSDSRDLALPTKKELISKNFAHIQKTTKSILLLPFQIIVALHLLSSLAVVILLIILLIRSKLNEPKKSVEILTILLGANLVWLSLTSIAYIGSNGRYLYLPAVLSFLTIYYKSEKHGLKRDSYAI